MTPRPVIVTRPGEPGAQLTRDLAAAGLLAVWVPAFTLGPPPDERRVAEVLGRLAQFQLAIFVSMPAVEATAKRLPGPWPGSTAVAAVGAGTRRAVADAIPSAAAARCFAPGKAGDGESGSEALWNVLRPALSGIRRALILRAQHGREWLGENLASAGVEVENLAVYSREAATPAAPEHEQVFRGQGGFDRAVVLFTSSEAVDTFVGRLDPGGRALLGAARVLAPHERIVARARAAGFTDVHLATLDIDAIRQAALAQ